MGSPQVPFAHSGVNPKISDSIYAAIRHVIEEAKLDGARVEADQAS